MAESFCGCLCCNQDPLETNRRYSVPKGGQTLSSSIQGAKQSSRSKEDGADSQGLSLKPWAQSYFLVVLWQCWPSQILTLTYLTGATGSLRGPWATWSLGQPHADPELQRRRPASPMWTPAVTVTNHTWLWHPLPLSFIFFFSGDTSDSTVSGKGHPNASLKIGWCNPSPLRFSGLHSIPFGFFHVTNYVYFRLLSSCHPSESLALRWKEK